MKLLWHCGRNAGVLRCAQNDKQQLQQQQRQKQQQRQRQKPQHQQKQRQRQKQRQKQRQRQTQSKGKDRSPWGMTSKKSNDKQKQISLSPIQPFLAPLHPKDYVVVS